MLVGWLDVVVEPPSRCVETSCLPSEKVQSDADARAVG